MIDQLKLLCADDIPFIEGNFTIHQPTLEEIGYIGEKSFWTACQVLKFNKDFLSDQDKLNLLNKTNFNIILTMIKENNIQSRESLLNVNFLLALIFPKYEITIGKETIQLKHIQTNQIGEINNNNFEKFKSILIQMFCLNSSENKQYNPSGPLAKRIADKIARGHRKKAQLAPQPDKIAILSRYMSILAVGENKDLNILKKYTIYQLLDEFNRYMIKTQYDDWVKYKIAGATGLSTQPPDWLKDIHTDKD